MYFITIGLQSLQYVSRHAELTYSTELFRNPILVFDDLQMLWKIGIGLYIHPVQRVYYTKSIHEAGCRKLLRQFLNKLIGCLYSLRFYEVNDGCINFAGNQNGIHGHQVPVGGPNSMVFGHKRQVFYSTRIQIQVVSYPLERD